ncbi:MAG: hypothetical protein EYC62_07545 [Alphaproteobacteria bacterium]|nr:MAG: hypothetical protein EYC62_07545 [Alphaproteobacteria bacterium]
MMVRIFSLFLVLLSLSGPVLAQTETKPQFPFPVVTVPAPAASQPSAPKRIDQVWRLPNGYEEYYILLARATADKNWCDRISLEAQVRKPDARPGVQVIGWRDICLIEVAGMTRNQDLCRFIRGTTVDALDGQEFNQNYCLQYVAAMANGSYISTRANHWLQIDPNKPKFLNAQAILKYVGFTEDDLVSTQKKGLYQMVNKFSWDEFLLQKMLNPEYKKMLDPEQFNRLVSRSLAFPDYSKSPQPVDRFLRYTGTAVKLPADCYENPTSEFTCRMLECLNVRDIITCRAIGNTQEVLALKELFINKCTEKMTASTNAYAQCSAQINAPYNKIFKGSPETFLPYLNR